MTTSSSKDDLLDEALKVFRLNFLRSDGRPIQINSPINLTRNVPTAVVGISLVPLALRTGEAI